MICSGVDVAVEKSPQTLKFLDGEPKTLCNRPAPRSLAEPVKEFETVVGQSLCMSASREGSLIHATVGILGGVGRRPWNRWGFAL